MQLERVVSLGGSQNAMLENWQVGAAIVAFVIAATILILLNLRRLDKRHRDDFDASLHGSRSEHEAAARAAKKKLSQHYAVIEIIHDLSDYGLGPAGLPEGVSFDEAFEVVRLIRAAKHQAIMVVLHTAGGYSLPSDMIARALTEHHGKKIAVIPYMAMSGGTVIAIATEEVQMGATATLGPIGTQFREWPVAAYEFLLKEKKADHIKDENLMTLFVARQFERDASTKVQNRMHENHHKPALVDALMAQVRAHSDAISKSEAKDLGVNVSSKEAPKEAFALVDARLRIVALDRKRVARDQLNLKVD